MSDSDETDSYRSDDEEDERIEDSHNSRLTAAQEWIIDAVRKRKSMPVEGTTRKVKLTEEDVDQFFEEFPDLTHDGNENAPTLLHVIVDLVSSTVGASIESATVKALVQRLVQRSTRLLCIRNDEQQNPLYLAISKKKKILADYMVASCPQEENHRQHLVKAYEDCHGNEKGKNCLHLAFEKDLKPTTLLQMVKDASIATLEAVDITGKRPMHYAVQYSHCNVKVIRAFIERDNEAREHQNQASGNQPPETFLDVDERATTSVYLEHVLSAKVHNEERIAQKVTLEHNMKKGEPAGLEDDRGRHSQAQMDDSMRGRNPATKGKPDPKSENRLAARPEQSYPAGSHDIRNPQDRSGRPRERERDRRMGYEGTLNEREEERERLKRMEAEANQSRRQDLERSATAREGSKDRHGFAPPGGRDALRLQTDLVSSAVANPDSDIAANTPKLLKRVLTMKSGASAEMPDKKVKQTVASTKKSRKSVDHEAAARVSKTVLHILKLHYMRTRTIERATSWLYRTNPQDVQTFFDYHKLPNELKEDLFERAFQATKFDELLHFVHFTNVKVIRRQKANSKNQRSNGAFGRQDMEFFFNFLHRKGVRYILKVVVEEGEQSVHSDEAIMKALDRVTVEHLDWRKVDLDPQLICGISSQAEGMHDGDDELDVSSKNQLRRLDLRWSGNSAVLRAWSEPEGLPSLPHLETVNIIVPDGTVLYDSPEWILQKKKEFEERLNKHSIAVNAQHQMDESSPTPCHRKVVVNLRGLKSATDKKGAVGSLQSGATQGGTSEKAAEKIINTHEWLKCMDAFAKNINPLWTSTRANYLSSIGSAGLVLSQEAASRRARLEDEVVVALIDDGVSLLDQNFVGRVLEGKTFDYREGHVGKTFDYREGGVGQSYNSAHGHGTEMARCILRACPMARVYPIRLKTHPSANGRNTEIDLESAALAINAALEKNATIISMSWTIPIPKEPHPAQGRFEAAVRKACSRNVLMFCSSADEGHITNVTYPSAVHRDRIFRIGAAHDDGLAFRLVGKDVDFILPGVEVNVNSVKVATGSSVATALAAGLAATIIYCCKISALAVKTQTQTVSHDQILRQTFTESAVQKLSQHEDMKAAFGLIGQVNDQRFIQIWDTLQPLVNKLEDNSLTNDHITKIGHIMNLCNKLMVH